MEESGIEEVGRFCGDIKYQPLLSWVRGKLHGSGHGGHVLRPDLRLYDPKVRTLAVRHASRNAVL